MDEGVIPGDVGRPFRRPDAAPGDVDRLEALEQHVRQLTSRLAGWVEAQLVQALDDRRDDMKALRAELQAVVNEQLAGVRAEASSVLIVTTRRLEVAQEQLSERLDAVAERAADAAARAIALSGSSSTEAERLELLEEQVDQRLALVPDLVKAQVAAAADRQRALVDAARTELTALLDERLADGASASATRVSAIQERLGAMSASLNARLDDVAGQAAVAADDAEVLRAEAGRVEAFEQRVKAAMGRLTDSVEARLAEVHAGRETEIEALRSGLSERLDGMERESRRALAGVAELEQSVRTGGDRADAVEARLAVLIAAREAEIATLRAEAAASATALERRLDGMTLDMAAAVDGVVALRSDAEAGATHLDELEQRVKAAVGRLAESVEARLSELSAGRPAELRAEIDAATSALGARFAQVHDRIDAVEQQSAAADGRADAMVEAKLVEVVERRRAELEDVRSELEETLATQLRQARSEIGTAVADAHRRFVVSVDELDERMGIVAGQAVAAEAAVARFELMEEAVSSDGRRIEALEVHTRRTDARLGQVIDEKMADLAGERGAELEGDHRRVRDALDAHLIETRAEVTSALGEGREQLAAGAAALEERQAKLDAQATDAAVRLDALAGSVEVALSEGEERVAQTLDARLATIDTLAAKVATLDDLAAKVGGGRTETTAGIAALQRRVAKMQDQVEKRVASVVDQVDALTAAAASEVGTLAPLRSDLRRLQAQVTELAEVVAELRPRRKPPAAPVKKASAARRRASSQ